VGLGDEVGIGDVVGAGDSDGTAVSKVVGELDASLGANDSMANAADGALVAAHPMSVVFSITEAPKKSSLNMNSTD
jgi:hypothetical protein